MSALAEALIAAQAELPTALGRDAANESAGYRYMTLDALIAATRPILNAHGLSITQWPTTILRGDDGLVPGLTTRITHESGESVEDTMPLYFAVKTMQEYGSSVTYGRRYAWQSACGLTSEDDDDNAPLPQDDSIPF